MKKIKLIYNSKAGKSRFKYFLDAIIEKFIAADFDVSVFRASKKTNLYEYLKQIDPNDCYGIVIAGGDGTINQIVNILIKNKIDIPIAIIPAGTSNDFARHLKMPSNFNECIDKILLGNIQPVDVGLANDRYFINVCSAGLFTNASQKTDTGLKNMFGHLAYVMTAVKQAFRFKPLYMRFEANGKVYEEKIYLFLALNGSSAGGMDKFALNASIQDGLLDVIIIKDCKIGEATYLLGKVLAGKHLKDKNLIYLKTNELKINKIKGKCDPPDVDGEEGPKFPIEIKCMPNALRMFI